jgi:hypothetical protein
MINFGVPCALTLHTPLSEVYTNPAGGGISGKAVAVSVAVAVGFLVGFRVGVRVGQRVGQGVAVSMEDGAGKATRVAGNRVGVFKNVA